MAKRPPPRIVPKRSSRAGYDAPLYLYLPEGTRAKLQRLTDNESATVRTLVLGFIQAHEKDKAA